MTLDFKAWIVKNKHLSPQMGDLARDIADDPNFPKTRDREIILQYLDSKHADSAALMAFSEAWNIYRYLQ